MLALFRLFNTTLFSFSECLLPENIELWQQEIQRPSSIPTSCLSIFHIQSHCVFTRHRYQSFPFLFPCVSTAFCCFLHMIQSYFSTFNTDLQDKSPTTAPRFLQVQQDCCHFPNASFFGGRVLLFLPTIPLSLSKLYYLRKADTL